MSKGILIIDGLNILHAANATKQLSVGSQPTQAILGFLRFTRQAILTYPQLTPIVAHDGRSWRYDVYKEYKASRNKPPVTATEIKMADLRGQLKEQKAFVVRAMELLQVRQISALNLEADDLAAILSRKAAAKGQKVLLLSADKDWIQLIQPNVTWFDPIRDVRLTYETLPKRLGWDDEKKRIVAHKSDQKDMLAVPSPRAWLEMKALMGDSSDEISGVGGIGERGAIEFINQFGSVGGFFNQSIDGTLPVLPKKFASFATDVAKQELWRRNMLLMDLNSPEIPEAINLKITPGKYDEPAFGELCEELLFKSILSDLPGWCEDFQRRAA